MPGFEDLAREHGPVLRSVALRLCRNPSDAQDLVQDTLERALRSFQSLPAGANLRAWLIAILRNRFIDSCRKHSKEAPHPDASEIAEVTPAQVPEPEPRWASITPEQVKAALSQLPEEFRAVYTLHAIERKAYSEIAARLGIPKATVGTRLLRARQKLKALLLPGLGEEEAE